MSSALGLLPTNGAEWRRVRTLLQKPANRTSISGLISSLNLVAEEFVEYMDRHFICVNKDDFLDHLNRVFLEMTGVVTFDTRYSPEPPPPWFQVCTLILQPSTHRRTTLNFKLVVSCEMQPLENPWIYSFKIDR